MPRTLCLSRASHLNSRPRPANTPSLLPSLPSHSVGHAIRAQRRPSQCSSFHSQFSFSSLSLSLSLFQSPPHLAVNVFLNSAAAAPESSFSCCQPTSRQRQRESVSLFDVVHPCTANSACHVHMNYEGMKPNSRRYFVPPSTLDGRGQAAADQWSVGLTAGGNQ